MYGLRFVFVDKVANEFVELAGFVMPVRLEQQMYWDSLPVVADSNLVVDRIGDNLIDIEDAKCISQETVEQVLGKPLSELIAEGKRLEGLAFERMD